MNLAFDQPWVLLLAPLLLLPLLRAGRPAVGHPWLQLLPRDAASRRLEALLRVAGALALVATMLAAAGLHRPAYDVERIGRGAHMVLLLDRSASMDQAFAGLDLKEQLAARSFDSKGVVARRLLSDFVARREHDLFGMVAFSTYPIPVLPLTGHHDIVQAAITAGDFGRGLAQTDIGKGLLRAIDYFADKPFTGSRIILLVSDGAGEMSLATKRRIEHGLRKNRVALYWIYIRTAHGPTLTGDETGDGTGDGDVLPERALHAFFSGLEGQYRAYTAESPADLERAVDDVSNLQNLPIRYQETIARLDLGSGCFLLGVLAVALLLLARVFAVREWRT